MHSFIVHSWVPERSDKITAIRLSGTIPPRLLSALPHHCPQLASSCKSTALLRYYFHHVRGRLYCYCAKGHTLACCRSGTPTTAHWYAICLTWFKCTLPIIQPFCTDLSPEVPTVLAVKALQLGASGRSGHKYADTGRTLSSIPTQPCTPSAAVTVAREVHHKSITWSESALGF